MAGWRWCKTPPAARSGCALSLDSGWGIPSSLQILEGRDAPLLVPAPVQEGGAGDRSGAEPVAVKIGDGEPDEGDALLVDERSGLLDKLAGHRQESFGGLVKPQPENHRSAATARVTHAAGNTFDELCCDGVDLTRGAAVTAESALGADGTPSPSPLNPA
ncbi:hypothetical protein ADUPG1_003341, partial [Aduncisulcus paluster]